MTQRNPPTDAELSEWDRTYGGSHPIARLVTEVRRLRAAPLGYDAAMRVAEAVHDACADEMACRGGFNPDLPALVRATLGDDAVARADREVVEAAIAWHRAASASVGDWTDLRTTTLMAAGALVRAREEAGKR